ncbi:MAG: hypothetical protein QOH69_994 [Actinomycetota bacterium]|jgi:uncharacterized repeat protein (TIGR02543 family)/LPXTG-motif cell wall-anchored protein|nr:hypothetical protein [Actinomycetota bacterium]
MSRRPVFAVAIVVVSAWLILGLVPAASAAVVTTVAGGMTFTADDTNVAAGATVTAYTPGPTSVVIPSTVVINAQTYNVTGVGVQAFMTKGLTSVVLPATLTSIGTRAFRNNSLTAISLPPGLLTIGDQAFLFNQIGSVVIPDSVTDVGQAAFESNNLSSVTIGTGITLIRFAVFESNPLTSVVIPPNVTVIVQQAFTDDQLTSVDFQGPLTYIGPNAFLNNNLTSVTFPATVTDIEVAFVGNPSLTSFTFLGPPPTTFQAAGGPGSLDGAPGITVNYLWANDVAQTAGGFTTPNWQGYNTQELVTTTFNLNGHGNAIDPQRIPDGDAPAKPLAPTATQWTFKGWYTDAALTVPASFTDPLTADQTLFARWDPTLAVTGGTINYGALWAGAVAVSLGVLLMIWARRRRTR